MTRRDALEIAAAAFDNGDLLEDLRRRVAWQTESDGRGDARTDARQALATLEGYLRDELLPQFRRLGFACEVIDNPVPGAGPFLVARRVEGADLPTVLSYGHGDVVNGQVGRWREGLAPWQLRVEGDRWYGRGTADNKGQHSINLAALAAVIQARRGRLGYNLTFLIEMGEEAGSPGLHAFCQTHADRLRADLFLASDGPRIHARRPTLFLGSRGAVNFSLSLRCRERAYHCGNWGGVLANPATVLSHALASMVDAQGRLLVDGLRPPPIPASVRRMLQSVEIGTGEDDPALDAGWGEPGLSAAERLMAWNTLEVLAIGSGQVDRPINAIPPEAKAHCQLRFVVGTPWRDLADIVRTHLQARGFGAVQVEVQLEGAATRLDPDSPWIDWAADSITRSCGQAPTLLPNLAGSLPNDVFADLLGLPTLWVPHSYPACAQHAPNEHLLASVAREGLQLMAGLFWDLGESAGTEGAAPWSARH